MHSKSRTDPCFSPVFDSGLVFNQPCVLQPYGLDTPCVVVLGFGYPTSLLSSTLSLALQSSTFQLLAYLSPDPDPRFAIHTTLATLAAFAASDRDDFRQVGWVGLLVVVARTSIQIQDKPKAWVVVGRILYICRGLDLFLSNIREACLERDILHI